MELIDYAKDDNFEKVVETLKSGVEQEDKNKALLESCYNDNYEISKILLENNADPNYQIDGGNTCLIYASMGKNWLSYY